MKVIYGTNNKCFSIIYLKCLAINVVNFCHFVAVCRRQFDVICDFPTANKKHSKTSSILPNKTFLRPSLAKEVRRERHALRKLLLLMYFDGKKRCQDDLLIDFFIHHWKKKRSWPSQLPKRHWGLIDLYVVVTFSPVY